MKLRLFSLLTVCMLLICATGCQGGGSDGTPPADTIAQSILEQLTFRTTMTKVEGALAENYYQLDSAITEYAIYLCGNGETAEEVAVFKVSDKKNLSLAQDAIDKRLEDQRFRYESYIPTEMVKLNDPVIVTKDDTIVLVLADDRTAAEKAVSAALEHKIDK